MIKGMARQKVETLKRPRGRRTLYRYVKSSKGLLPRSRGAFRINNRLSSVASLRIPVSVSRSENPGLEPKERELRKIVLGGWNTVHDECQTVRRGDRVRDGSVLLES